MKPSTALEVVGFGLLSFAAYRWNPLVGYMAAGLFLVLIGYSFDDMSAAVSFQRAMVPFRMRRARRKLARQNKRFARKKDRRHLLHRQPTEVDINVRVDQR